MVFTNDRYPRATRDGRLQTEDEKLLTEMEKRYFGKLSFRKDPTLHAEHFKIFNAATNEELASVGGP